MNIVVPEIEVMSCVIIGVVVVKLVVPEIDVSVFVPLVVVVVNVPDSVTV